MVSKFASKVTEHNIFAVMKYAQEEAFPCVQLKTVRVRRNMPFAVFSRQKLSLRLLKTRRSKSILILRILTIFVTRFVTPYAT